MRTEPENRASPFRGIGFRTSVAVNSIILSVVAGFIAFDAVRETCDHIRERAEALDEQAMTIHGVVSRKPVNASDVQRFIDGVCQRMSDTTSPGHHIVVESGGWLLQSQSHGRASDELVAAIQIAAAAQDRRAAFGDGSIVTGAYSEAGARVYVAERLDDILREVRGRVLARSLGVLAVGLLLAVAVHWLLHRLVSGPLRRLVGTIESIRAGNLGAQSGPFRVEELDRLAAAVNAMSQTLANDAERRRLALAQARRVQQNLLPRSGDIAPGVQVAAIHHPAEVVAGDYYDVLALSDGSVVCCVADVVGHGVPAAMVAAILKILVLDAVEAAPDPGAIIRRVNSRLYAVVPTECFASLLVVRWCAKERRLWHASAGHEPGLVLSGSTTRLLGATGTLLGVTPEGNWDTESVEAPEGSILVAFSDGLTEAMARDGELFGRSRLKEVLVGTCWVDPRAVVQTVDEAVQHHLGGSPPTDDYTLMSVRFG